MPYDPSGLPRPQCRATAKGTGLRCTLTADPGGVVCRHHGGRSPQAQRKAVERRIVAEALMNAETIDPRDALAAAINGAYAVMKMVTEQLSSGDPGSSFGLEELAAALDRVAKFSAVGISAGIEERRVRLAEGMAAQLAGVLRGVLDYVQLDEAQWERVPAALSLYLDPLIGDRRRVIEG